MLPGKDITSGRRRPRATLWGSNSGKKRGPAGMALVNPYGPPVRDQAGDLSDSEIAIEEMNDPHLSKWPSDTLNPVRPSSVELTQEMLGGWRGGHGTIVKYCKNAVKIVKRIPLIHTYRYIASGLASPFSREVLFGPALGAPSGERSTLGARRSALTTPTSAALAPRPRLHSRPATHEHASGTRVLTSRPSAADFAASSFPMLPTQGQDCTLAHDSLSVSTTSR